MELFDQFKEHWAVKKFVLPGQAVLLAVSGGADSMVMAHLFLKSGISFGIAHCNFGLRAEASDLDEQLVKTWCDANQIAFHTIKFDTRKKSLEWKKGTQETARDLRYQWFEEVRAAHGYAKIATAHHANDNVETLLINLLKGTGISGLHGIPPVNGTIIRPLLFAGKSLLSAYQADNNVAYREDASNASDDYLRNAVRHNLIPVAENLFPGAVANVSESIVRFSEAELLYRKAIDLERKKLLEQRGKDHYIPLLKLRRREPLATIIYELFQPFGFSPRQAPQIVQLMGAGSGHYITSQSHRVIRDRDFLIITQLPAPSADMIIVDSAPCSIDAGKYTYTFSVSSKPAQIPADANEAWLDLKMVTFPILLRKQRTGDYLYPLGMGMKKKKVGRLLTDQKIALPDKEEIKVLECGKRIAWVSGIRIDERFKINGNTENVLVVKRTLTSGS